MDISIVRGASRSRTIWFAGSMIAAGVLEQAAGVVTAVVPEEYKGIAIAVIGLMTAVLRLVTNKPLTEK